MILNPWDVQSKRISTTDGTLPAIYAGRSAWMGSEMYIIKKKPDVVNSSGGGIAGTLDSHYWKGCGERQGAEREFVSVKKRGVDDLPTDNRASDGK